MLSRIYLTLLIGLTFISQPFAQTETEVAKAQATSSVSGRITLENKPAENISVVLLKRNDNEFWRQTAPVAQAKTDSDGRFSMNNIPAGKYSLKPQAAAYVFISKKDSNNYWEGGRQIVVEANENIENLEIPMVRGGVISGKLIDSNNRSVIGVKVKLKKLNEKGETDDKLNFPYYEGSTDDRGIYRYYGLMPGKYVVSFGVDTKKAGLSGDFFQANSKFYPLTFHPATPIESESKIVELAAGDVAEGIDIKVGEKISGYKISGKIVADASLKANPKTFRESNIIISLVAKDESNTNQDYGGTQVLEDGTFIVKGLVAGKYRLRLDFYGDSEIDSSPIDIEVTDKDIKDAEIKAFKGLTLSGKVEIQNTSSANFSTKPSQISLEINSADNTDSEWRETAADEKGAIKFKGLSAGKKRFYIGNYPRIKGLVLGKIQHNGSFVTEGITIPKGQALENVTFILIYGNCSLRGEVKTENGEIADGGQIRVIAKSTEEGRLDEYQALADERGKFLLEGLPSGEFEITVSYFKPKEKMYDDKYKPVKPKIEAKKKLIILNDTENVVSISIDLQGEAK